MADDDDYDMASLREEQEELIDEQLSEVGVAGPSNQPGPPGNDNNADNASWMMNSSDDEEER